MDELPRQASECRDYDRQSMTRRRRNRTGRCECVVVVVAGSEREVVDDVEDDEQGLRVLRVDASGTSVRQLGLHNRAIHVISGAPEC